MPGTEVAQPNESVLQGVAKLLGLPDAASLSEVKPSGLWRLTQRELLDVARTLGLAKVSRLKKEALLARVWAGLAEVGAVPGMDASGAVDFTVPPVTMPTVSAVSAPAAVTAPRVITREAPRADVPIVPTGPDARDSRPGAVHKFEVGEGTAADLAALRAESDARIPWAYGRDRVSAMPVDPDRLYAYWEVTDDAIAKARAGLGAGGADAYLCLRLYDITGRIFDGTNAHSYSDHGMDRAQRQWFFHVGKPTSEGLLEVGLKSHEGYFVKIARSGRIVFPPRDAAGEGHIEWLTVRVATGEIESGHSAPPPGVGQAHAGRPAAGGWSQDGGGFFPAGFFAGFHPEGAGDVRRFMWGGRLLSGHEGEWSSYSHWEEVGSLEVDAEVFRSWSWAGDLESESWSAGPFSYPVDLPGHVQETYGGPARVFRNGARTHVVWGPWQVVIKGIGARAEREVLGQWEIYRSWSVVGLPAGVGTPDAAAVAGKLGVGASERRLGASELRLGGASERAFLAASERRLGGSSERRWGGASELRLGGASEYRLGGASELRRGGASERLGGASERRLGASEGRLDAGVSARPLPPPVVSPDNGYPEVKA